jgi:hypothetical protein
MYEYIRSASVRGNEAITLFAIEELDHAVLARATLGRFRTRATRTEAAFLGAETSTATATAFVTECPARAKSTLVGLTAAEAATAKITARTTIAAAKSAAITATAAEAATVASAKSTAITTAAATEAAAITTTKSTTITAAETAAITSAETTVVTTEAAISTAKTASAALAAATAAEPTIFHSQSLSRGAPPRNQFLCLEALASLKTDSWLGRTIIGTGCARAFELRLRRPSRSSSEPPPFTFMTETRQKGKSALLLLQYKKKLRDGESRRSHGCLPPFSGCLKFQ